MSKLWALLLIFAIVFVTARGESVDHDIDSDLELEDSESASTLLELESYAGAELEFVHGAKCFVALLGNKPVRSVAGINAVRSRLQRSNDSRASSLCTAAQVSANMCGGKICKSSIAGPSVSAQLAAPKKTVARKQKVATSSRRTRVAKSSRRVANSQKPTKNRRVVKASLPQKKQSHTASKKRVTGRRASAFQKVKVPAQKQKPSSIRARVNKVSQAVSHSVRKSSASAPAQKKKSSSVRARINKVSKAVKAVARSTRNSVASAPAQQKKSSKKRRGGVFKKIKNGVKKAGRGIKKVAKKAGNGIKKAAKKTGKGIKKAGRGIKKVAKKAGKGIKKVAHKVKTAIKKLVKEIKSGRVTEVDLFLANIADAMYKHNLLVGQTHHYSYNKKCVPIKVVARSEASKFRAWVSYVPALQAIVVSFRGTANSKNAKSDLDFKHANCKFDGFKCGKVHRGMNKLWTQIRASFTKKIREVAKQHGVSKLFVTGHSLGGGVSLISAIDLAQHFSSQSGSPIRDILVSIIGSPRVGNSAFAKSFNQFTSQRSAVHLSVHRFEHQKRLLAVIKDPISQLPPKPMGFAHVGATIPLNCKKCSKFLLQNIFHLHHSKLYIDDMERAVGHKNAQC